MRLFLALALVTAGLALAEDRAVPVVVELFTSEGCSSCPPADRLLDYLDHTQPVAGALVVALEEHVDYWNQLGWTDRFSNAQYRMRQNDYASRVFFTDNIYTPQMVVNGQIGFSGGDATKAQQEIARAVRSQTTVVDLKAEPNASAVDLVDLTVDVSSPTAGKMKNSNVYLAVTESGLTTSVGAGENAGRKLKHAPVVRSFGLIAKLDARGGTSGHVTNTLRLPLAWHRENLRAVVFVQERDSFRITGAGMIDLPAR